MDTKMGIEQFFAIFSYHLTNTPIQAIDGFMIQQNRDIVWIFLVLKFFNHHTRN